jgi:transcriptional regulator with XRE-family HTH domain
VAKTAERKVRDEPSAKDLGRHLRQVRRKQGLSRAEVARSAGLTRRELAAYERGRVHIPESDLWCLAGSCGVEVGELLPHRDELRIDSSLASLAIGDSIRHLRTPAEPDGLLREYLAMIYELRNLPPGSRIPLRETDLATLADALGGAPEVIEMRLMELIGASHEEAARLRAMILPPLAIAGPGLAGNPPSAPDDFAAAIAGTGPDAVDDFFAAPRVDDPFAGPLAAGTEVTIGRSPSDPLASLPVDPFAVPADASPMANGHDTAVADALPGLRPDPFAPPGAQTETLEATVAASHDEPFGLEEPDGTGIDASAVALDAGSMAGHDVLSPIIPERDPWEIPSEMPADPLAPMADDPAEPLELVAPIAWRAPALVPDTAAPLALDDATIATSGAGHTIGVQVGDDYLTVHVDGEVVVKVDRQLPPEG